MACRVGSHRSYDRSVNSPSHTGRSDNALVLPTWA